MEKTDNIDYELEEPINFTDPYVLHDSNLDKPIIIELYTPNDIVTDNEEDHGVNKDHASIKVAGMQYPLVQLNSKVLNKDQIKKLVINYDNFLTTIELHVYDPSKLIQNTDIPGFNNLLKVIIVPEVQNVYKSISLEFKITSAKAKGDTIIYYGRYKVLEFNKKRIKELIYSGCSNEKEQTNEDGEVIQTIKCNPNENKQPNTWEMLHIIANECNLGFSSTDKCQDIEDRLPRLIYNRNYEDFIYDQLSFSGLDEESVFDAWVDLYGYLVMVNVAWVLNNEDVTPLNLGIYTFMGVHATDDNHVPEQSSQLVPRVITNAINMPGVTNLSFRKYNFIVDNSALLLGTSTSMYNFGLLDINGGQNAINQYDVTMNRNSLDDQRTEDYEMQNQKQLIIECNELPINKQKLIRQSFFRKHRQRILEVKLEKINLGLQRGTLINVAIFENDTISKQVALSQASQVLEDVLPEPGEITGDDFINHDIPEDYADTILDETAEVLNLGLSGMYYIDSMKFEYSSDLQEIKQYLRLIKKSNLNNLTNLSTPYKINEM